MVFIYPVIFFAGAIACYLWYPKQQKKERLRFIGAFALVGVGALGLAVLSIFVAIDLGKALPVIIGSLILATYVNHRIEKLYEKDDNENRIHESRKGVSIF